MRELAEKLEAKLGDSVEHEGKAQLVLTVAKPELGRYKAGELIKSVAQLVGGSGGGRPDTAQAGGTKPARLGEAIESLRVSIDGLCPAAAGNGIRRQWFTADIPAAIFVGTDELVKVRLGGAAIVEVHAHRALPTRGAGDGHRGDFLPSPLQAPRRNTAVRGDGADRARAIRAQARDAGQPCHGDE